MESLVDVVHVSQLRGLYITEQSIGVGISRVAFALAIGTTLARKDVVNIERAARAGLKVTLYDAASRLGEGSAAWAAAGMITPAAEVVEADAEIVAMGRHSLALWP